VAAAPTLSATLPAGYVDELLVAGRAAGLDAIGIAPATTLERAHAALVERKAAGLHDGMSFTYRNPERATDPQRLVAGAQAIVVGAVGYRRPAPRHPGVPSGRVARYAWRDHYGPLRQSLGVLAGRLRADGHRAVVVADDNGLVDREVAYRAGIGWFGKNANLLLPGRGSWFVLGAVVTTAPLLPTAPDPVADGCGSCRRCLDGCPTGAIVAPGVVDASRCLAWLVQKAGVFPRQYRRALGDRIYGCDDCQEVCPPNVRLERVGPAADTGGDARPGDLPADAPSVDADEAWVPLVELLVAGDDALLARHGRWYIPARDPRWLRRNALIALGNIGVIDDDVVATLARYLRHDDPMLRAHAVWAARRLGRDDLLAVVATDDDPLVQAELVAPSP
jgi:epoxyqueuosine reductase